MTTFYIEDIEIDLSRSVLIKGDAITQVEPKVLKVLHCLAQHQNEVVSHETLMTEVWQGAQVVPNALQRCIAILRKELNDDAKSPRIIATHPRIGYRLLKPVRFKTPSTPQPLNADKSAHQTEIDKPTQSLRWVILGLGLVGLGLASMIAALSFSYLDTSKPITAAYTRVIPVTQTDAHETHAIYNPNGEHLVFNRYAGGCKSHLWARNASTGQETRLTAEPGEFGAASFTPGGRELVFAARASCNKLTTDKPANATTTDTACWSIATLDFAQTLSTPQLPSQRFQCQAAHLAHPHALPNHEYVFLQANDSRHQLMHYNDLTKALKPLYASDVDYLYHFDFDPQSARLAVFSRTQELKHQLTLLSVSGQVLSQHLISPPSNTKDANDFVDHHWYANFTPSGNQLLATIQGRLYQIDLNETDTGSLQATEITSPQANLVTAIPHPSKPQLLAVVGAKDTDITKLTIGEPAKVDVQQDLDSTLTPYTSLHRTAAKESKAKFQPKGSHIAFVSNRSGQDQLWLSRTPSLAENSKPKPDPIQLTNNPGQSLIHDFSWSPDGQQLAWSQNGKLATSDLNGQLIHHQTALPIFSVLHWYQADQLLVLVQDPFPGGLYRLNLTTGALKPLGMNQVEQAWVMQDKLIYSDTHGKVFTRAIIASNNTPKQLESLNGKALVVTDSYIYSVVDNQLQEFDLNGQWLQTLMPLKPTAWKITDIKDQQLLLDQFIAINHDIVVLEPAQKN